MPASAGVARALGIKPGEAVVEIRRTYRLLDGSVAEITLNHYNARNFRFSMHLRKIRGGG